MSKTIPVKVSFEAVDKITSDVRRISDKIKGITKPLRDQQSAFSELGQALMLDVVGNRMGAVRDSFSALFGSIARAALMLGGAFGAAFATVKSFTDAADEIGDAAERIGVTTDALQELRYAATLSDVTVEELDQSMKFLNKNMVEAARGSGEAGKWLNAFGLKATKPGGGLKTADEMLMELSAKFATMESGALKTAGAMALFGRSGDKMPLFLSKGPEEIARLRKEAQAMGMVLSKESIEAASEFDKKLKMLGKSVAGMRNQVAMGMLPAFQELGTALLTFFAENRGAFIDFGKALGDALKESLPMIIGFLKTLTAGMKWFTELPVEQRVALLSMAFKAFAFIALAPVIFNVMLLVQSLVMLGSMLSGPLIALLSRSPAIFSVLGLAINTVKAALWQLGRAAVMFLFTNPFGWAILAGLAIAGLIIYWDELMVLFKAGWAIIKAVGSAILEGILAPFDWAIQKVKTLLGLAGQGATAQVDVAQKFGEPLGAEQTLNQRLLAERSKNEVAVRVDFANAPKGTSMATDKNSGVALDLAMGWAMVN